MKKILITLLLCVLAFGSYAQQKTFKTYLLPKQGDLFTSLLLGRGQFANGIAASSSNTVIDVPSPNTGVTNGNNNPLINLVGAEIRYFVSDEIALRFSGGVIFTNTPGRENIPSLDASLIPVVNAVEAQQSTNLNVTLGIEKHFFRRSEHLSPYIGFAIPIFYARDSFFDPGFEGDVIDDQFGASNAILFGVGSQIYSGVDYHINKEIYFGIQINVLGYDYTLVQESAGSGFDIGQADTSSFNFLTQPVIKLGFKF